MYQIDFQKPEHVHFIGIGGISMSGLAEILMEEGFLQVDGSFTNTGLLSNGDLDKDTPDGETQNCQIVAASGITNTGGILNAGMIDGVVTNNEGTITLIGGTVKNIISNGGQIIEDGGKYGA
mgnify:CR=1 FL=1